MTLLSDLDPQPPENYREMVDLVGLQGMYVTEDPREGCSGVVMWCGYCCIRLHYDQRHMGVTPFLSLMVKMADAHRETDCSNPRGPFVPEWHPRREDVWEQHSLIP